MKKFIIFDFDRTLVDLDINWPKVRQRIFDLCLSFDIAPNGEKPLYGKIKEASQNLFEKTHNKKLSDKFYKNSLDIIKKEEIAAVKKAKLMRGAKEFLEWLRQVKIGFAVLSNNNSRCIAGVLKKFQLPRPKMIVGSDNVEYQKPNPEGLNKILRENKLDKNQCLLIGDSKIELDLGNTSGIKTFILTAYYKKKKINCDLKGNLIKNFDQLKEVVS